MIGVVACERVRDSASGVVCNKSSLCVTTQIYFNAKYKQAFTWHTHTHTDLVIWMKPQEAAAWRGVQPSLSPRFTSLPLSTRNCTISAFSSMQAWRNKDTKCAFRYKITWADLYVLALSTQRLIARVHQIRFFICAGSSTHHLIFRALPGHFSQALNVARLPKKKKTSSTSTFLCHQRQVSICFRKVISKILNNV